MIINQLYDKNNIVRYTATNFASSTMEQNKFSVKSLNDILSLKYTEPASAVYISVISATVSHLQDIDFDITGAYGTFKIETSIDFANWYELPFKTDGQNIYAYSSSVSGVSQYINIDTNEAFLDVSSDLNYVFKRFNKNSGEDEYLYSDLEYQFIRFTFTDITPTTQYPLYFNRLNILISEECDETYLKKRAISNRMTGWHAQKAFETYTFIPDVLDNFAKMLETNNQEDISSQYENINLQTSSIDIIVFDPAVFPVPDSSIILYMPIGVSIVGVNFRPR